MQLGRPRAAEITMAVATIVISVSAFAEPAETERIIRPRHRLLRHQEDWSGLAGWDRPQTGDPFDPIKYVPLSSDGSIRASFGGHVRTQHEKWNGFAFGGAGPREDTFLLTRIALHADLHVVDNHASRKIVSDYFSEPVRDGVLISAGNDGVRRMIPAGCCGAPTATARSTSGATAATSHHR